MMVLVGPDTVEVLVIATVVVIVRGTALADLVISLTLVLVIVLLRVFLVAVR